MNLEVDKLLWRKFDALDTYSHSNKEFYDAFQRIMEHHRKSINLFSKNLEAEVEMIDRLSNSLEQKQDFVMFKDLLPYFRDMFTTVKLEWDKKLKDFKNFMIAPLKL
jgi:hypothetical protein